MAIDKSVKPVKDKSWTKKYDRHFRKNSKHYFGPGFDWHFFKAQAIIESNLNPKAKSNRGAIGIMQIMPETYNEISKKQPRLGKIDEPKWNIAAAIYYNRQLYKRWKQKNISAQERVNFTFASYNAGFKGVLEARKKLREEVKNDPEVVKQWSKVSPYTSTETRQYIEKINQLMQIKPTNNLQSM